MEGLAAKKAELAAVVAALQALNDKLAAMQVCNLALTGHCLQRHGCGQLYTTTSQSHVCNILCSLSSD